MTTGSSDPSVRQILHVDMDAFFVSVELLERPELAGRPVVVGGSGPRGVVAAASYEARHFGVGSAMPSSVARRKCPHAVFLDGRHDVYSEMSSRIMAMFRDVTPHVEPLSLDEAFLDVSGASRSRGPAAGIASELRDSVFAELGLTCSVGVAPNKFLAKLASVHAKPTPSLSGPVAGSGVFVVNADRIREFLDPLPVRALWGVGKVTGDKLTGLGINTVRDVAALSVDQLRSFVGDAAGRHLHELSLGIDDRPVVSDVSAKSVSHEETFAVDIDDPAQLDTRLIAMSESVAARLREGGIAGRTIVLKLRFGDFTTLTRSATAGRATNDGREIARAAREMLGRIDVAGGVRLVGVGVTKLAEPGPDQLSIFDAEGPDALRDELVDAVDSIRERFGSDSISLARLVNPDGISTFQPGQRLWGPSGPPET